jgi:RNA polymerase sigma-70 factor, ECF subfamily
MGPAAEKRVGVRQSLYRVVLRCRITILRLRFGARLEKLFNPAKHQDSVPFRGTLRMDYQDLAPVQLARLCAQRNSEAWLEFIRRYQRPITLVVLRTLREAEETSTLLIDDLVQETYAALCADGFRLLRDFVEEYPSSLDAMVRVVAANLTRDHLRAHNAKKRGGDFHHVAYDSPAVANALSPNGRETIERHVQLKEIDAMLQRGRERRIPSARDRAIFWLHFRLGMSAHAIARMPTLQLTSKGVESSLRRTLSLLRKTLKWHRHGS